jgi:hypothetical protein
MWIVALEPNAPMEESVMASRTFPNAFFDWTWSAVLAGVFASLVVQILLTMLGFGIGLLAIDVPTAQSAPTGAGWAAFVWWAVSGIIAAFVGGAVAAANSPDQTGLGRVGHALAAWSVATVVVVAAAALIPASATSVAGNLVGPSYVASARIAYLSGVPGRETVGAATRSPAQAQIDEVCQLLRSATWRRRGLCGRNGDHEPSRQGSGPTCHLGDCVADVLEWMERDHPLPLALLAPESGFSPKSPAK